MLQYLTFVSARRIKVPFSSSCRSIEVAMGEKKDQIRKLEEEIDRDNSRMSSLEKRLQVSSRRFRKLG